MTTTYIALVDLEPPQIVKVLEKFQLITEPKTLLEDRIKLLRCSALFTEHFKAVKSGDILAGFVANNFVDLKSKDNVISIFGETSVTKSCCLECLKAVTNNKDKTGGGIQCSGCEGWFHNICMDSPLTQAFLKALPNHRFLRAFCKKCTEISSSIDRRLEKLEESMSKLTDQTRENKEVAAGSVAFSTQAENLTAGINDTNKMVRQLQAQSQVPKKKEEEDKEKQRVARTRLVRQPKSEKLTNSRLLFNSFRKDYPDVGLRQARTTAAGSIRLEFDDEATALAMDVAGVWKLTSFGGNEGLISLERESNAAIVQNVYNEYTEEELIAEVLSKCPTGSTCEAFKRKNFRGEEFLTGTLKIKYPTKADLEDALEGSYFRIFQQQVYLKKYVFKPRVIKCHNCQGFSHISRQCRSKTKCGKCGRDHATREFKVTDARKFKCAHCNGNHQTGDRICSVLQQKEEQILNRMNHD